jgi:hypothetical protein
MSLDDVDNQSVRYFILSDGTVVLAPGQFLQICCPVELHTSVSRKVSVSRRLPLTRQRIAKRHCVQFLDRSIDSAVNYDGRKSQLRR